MAKSILKKNGMRSAFSKRLTVRHVLAASVILFSSVAWLIAAGMEEADSMNPYDTAEEAAPFINPEDLAYKIILFDEINAPRQYLEEEEMLPEYLDETLTNAISRLEETTAFARIDKAEAPFPEEPYLRVKCTLLDYRIVSGGSRFLGGVMAGSSYMTYAVKVYDGLSGNLLHELNILTENNAWSGTFGGQDASLTSYLGKVLGDYLALRARKDKGSHIVPLEKTTPDDATFAGSDDQLMWAAKDNHEETSWDEAAQYAKDFRGGGYSDWRLPTDEELRTLYDKTNTIELSNGSEIHVAEGVTLTGHMCWTNIEKGNKAKYVDFSNGKAKTKKKEEVTSLRALVVRDIQ